MSSCKPTADRELEKEGQMPARDQGRFLMDGAHFSWWTTQPSVLTVSSAMFGRESLELVPGKCPETAAQQLARQILLDALEP